MVGFTARYVGGSLRLQQDELDDALWFDVDHLPDMPPPMSLAHHIIKTWIAEVQQKKKGTSTNI